MKSVKGKLLKKLKSIKPVGYLNPDRVLQVFAIDGFTDSYSKAPIPVEQPKLFTKESVSEKENIKRSSVIVSAVENQPEVIDVTELMKYLETDDDDDEGVGLNEEVDDKENITPNFEKEKENANVNCRHSCSPEIDVSCFRKPDLNSCTLFDPNLLAAFEQAVKHHKKMNEEERRVRIEQENLLEKKARKNLEDSDEITRKGSEKKARIDDDDANSDPLLEFEEKCPAGGEGSVILYTTTLKGIRKTFQDCNSLRFLLESFRVVFYERDVSMHTEYRDELWRILGGKVMPPRLFIKGRYIGGADEILTLHEQGKFKVLFNGIPANTCTVACEGCGGVRFVLCFICNGSHKIIADGGLSSKCLQCNENGLIVCPLCC